MAFPYKLCRHQVFPILCSLATIYFIFRFVLFQNNGYSRPPSSKSPGSATNSRPGHLNLTKKEYFQKYFNASLASQQSVPECGCSRSWMYAQSDLENRKLSSTCSDPGTQFSPNQNVVSFAMYFWDNPLLPTTKPSEKYFQKGLHLNIQAMRRHYPGYTIRLHTNTLKDPLFCQLYCENPDMFWCDVRNTPAGNFSKMYFTTWRFLPLGDPTVDIFLSRDLASVLSERESAVVQDWLNLPERKPMHLMRDKYEVHNVEMLGGLWGAKNGYFPRSRLQSNGKGAVEELAKNLRDKSKVDNFWKERVGFDQKILKEVVFKRAYQIAGYDSYHCTEWSKKMMIRPFPTKRKDNISDFVGYIEMPSKENIKPCPEECRPSWGKDWEYC